MTTIRQDDLVQSVADALQFISYYHPRDYIQALGRAYEREQSAAAKDAIAQILTNSRLCASVLDDPQFARRNTKDNTPAVISTQIVSGGKVAADVAAKGGGTAEKAMVMAKESLMETIDMAELKARGPRALRARWLRSRGIRSAIAERLAERDLDS